MKSVNTDRRLIDAIDQLLDEHPAGIREYDLIVLLDKRFPALYPKPDLSDKLTLFQHHFFLRHCLYVMQAEFSSQNQWTLIIDTISITKLPAHQSEYSLPASNANLRDYYLDLSNLNKETQSSVEHMLNDFWLALSKYHIRPEALSTLGLTGKETEQEKKQQYRKLIQQYHPDKGGDADTFRAIQEAWEAIKK